MNATVSAPAVSRRRRLPAEAPLWGFVLGDMTVFAMFFVAYLWQLGDDRAGFAAQAAHLIVWLGLFNTLVLLTSSYLVVRAVHAAQSGSRQRPWLVGAVVCAGLFIVSKLGEYTIEVSGGHTLTSSSFFMYYYVLTGLHLLHVVIGSTILVVWLRSLRHDAAPVGRRFIDGAGGYWHMVDLLWLLIFSFLYIGSHS